MPSLYDALVDWQSRLGGYFSSLLSSHRINIIYLIREQLHILKVSEGQFVSLPGVGLNIVGHAVQRKHDICVRANAGCIITNFSRDFLRS